MIRSIKCNYTEALSKGLRIRRYARVADVAQRKLRQLEIANLLEDLRVQPENHLEALMVRSQLTLICGCADLSVYPTDTGCVLKPPTIQRLQSAL